MHAATAHLNEKETGTIEWSLIEILEEWGLHA